MLHQLFNEEGTAPVFWSPGFKIPKIRTKEERHKLEKIALKYKHKITKRVATIPAQHWLEKIKLLNIDERSKRYIALTVMT
jgi:hypothetical protein